ncbi:hypothetical protein HMPREF9134_00185 [Porphyromonas catoniae F0037]|uniref:Uncharacterized protein n=1 Tax=Porphyromonas catoniae F0037 TaxID=1127696 RepID=L1NHL5_9PORP|nr:hypothetical protein HMPREF9134_00185 [Porphyromonas catoniae F0037]
MARRLKTLPHEGVSFRPIHAPLTCCTLFLPLATQVIPRRLKDEARRGGFG